MENSGWDVVVVGGGVAGLSAALMLGRARRRTLVVDEGRPRNRFAAHMHGVLGHDGISPAELVRRGRQEVAAYGVEVREGRVDRLERTGRGVRALLADGGRVAARAAVVATGITDDLPDVPGLAERWGDTVLHCPYCHGWEVRGQRLGVLTTSPQGLHQVELVRQWSEDVVVLSAGLGDLDGPTERRLRARGIRIEPAPVTEVTEAAEPTAGGGGLVMRTAGGGRVEVDALFTAGAPRTHDDLLAGLDLDRTSTPDGSFLSVDPAGRTSDDRVWVAGNLVDPAANVATALSAGALAGGAVNAALVEDEFADAVAGAEG
ncbi:NAD(P)/FAD-dependent oxidoreductase [Xylanimonas oleitrophica]|uniref:NAD(P)/FAD-dependent oxidoreductase n=1 Tax=Xylanimonas oleitrophica TaxID=2607479 RepID=A0A2W5WUN4_9MICO|nr:NAD(P)/FAD-dependent oxidoreductase [Xylanimonas oleitrophica]PZR51956.1 NAD(P)/FAD-dependent oxidoreductase [Xylanimonas oleitrophica]